jgi:DNA-directed RNA polymerase specialized sigma24 family protein
MQMIEALAIARLRQWAAMRCSNLQGKIRRPNARGWQRRDERTFDATLVRVIDFERALNMLRDDDEKVALVLRYRDRQVDRDIGLAIGCSIRKVDYLIPAARRRLAAILDRLNLL